MSMPQHLNITIAIDGDLTIEVTELDHEVIGHGGGNRHPIRLVCDMLVTREALKKHSDVWSAQLANIISEDGSRPTIEVKDFSVMSVKFWMDVLHGNELDQDADTMPVEEVWEVLAVADYFELDLRSIEGWFESWWTQKIMSGIGDEEYHQLLYPAHELDNAKAFAFLTKSLVYNHPRHIDEVNPTRHRHLRIRFPVIRQMNAARGSLRGKLHRGVFEKVNKFLESNCPCKEKALWEYCTGLARTGVWPLESHITKDVESLVHGLRKFTYEKPTGACVDCSSDLKSYVDGVALAVRHNFDGICLDCINLTRQESVPKTYWSKDREDRHDAGCRIRHDQATWYFSFMGRREDMDSHKKEKAQRWQKHHGHLA